MFYRIDSLSIFIAIFLYCVLYCNAVNSDYVLSYSNPTRDFEADIEIDQKFTQGNGLSLCSWMKTTTNIFAFFQAYDTGNSNDRLSTYISFQDKAIFGDDGSDETVVTDPDLENSKWFHLCVVMQEPTIKFFYNGSPIEQYIAKPNISNIKPKNLKLVIGEQNGSGGNGSFFLFNVFDKALTDTEAKNQYNCNSVDGDMLSWKDITSKSKEIIFKKDINIVNDTVPCPSVSPKPASVQSPNGMPGSPGTSSGDTNPSSSSGGMSPGSSSGGKSPSSSSGGMYPSSSSGGMSPSSSSGGMYPSSSSGGMSPSSSSGGMYPSSSSGSSSPGSSS